MGVEASRGTRPSAHAWLPFKSREDFLARGMRFLADGAAADDHLVYVSGRSREEMRRDVTAVPGVEQVVAAGGLTIVAYESRDVVHPEQQVASFAAATEQAVAGGRRGLRVLADLTGLAAGGQDVNLLRYEHLADRYMSGHAMASLCAVDVRAVPEPVVAALESVHPQTAAGSRVSGFRLLPDDEGLQLTGVVDSWDAEHLADVLAAIAPPPADLRLRLDEAEHLSVRALGALARQAELLRVGGGRLRVVGWSPVAERALAALKLDLLPST